MQFVFLLKGRDATMPQTLASNRLFVVASRETTHRSRRARDRDKKYSAAVPATGAPLQISGSRLRDLCWEASPLSSTFSLEKDDLTFNCVMAQTPYAGRTADVSLESMPLCVIAADSLDHIFFNVNEDLLQEGRLVVFTYAENLLHVGIDANAWGERRLAVVRTSGGVADGAVRCGFGTSGNCTYPAAEVSTSGAAPPPLGAEGDNSAVLTKRARRDEILWGEEDPARSARRVESPHRPHSPLKKEHALAVVPSLVSSEDIKELNELIDDGKLSSLDASLANFFCCQCYHLPLLTLTMSCCGAVLCQMCAPTPPTVEAVSVADRLCPVCGEEPLDPPLSHQARDAQVSTLVKELKVMYFPQLRAIRESRQVQAISSSPSQQPFLEPNASVLGTPR